MDVTRYQNISVVITATDNGEVPLASSTVVHVFINDVNDNIPIFDETYFEFIFDELAPPGQFHTTKVFYCILQNTVIIYKYTLYYL